MYCWLKQNTDPTQGSRMDVHELCSGGGFFEPLIVQTQKEKDYLLAMQLMVGKEFEVCLDGVDKPKCYSSPTWVSIPHL